MNQIIEITTYSDLAPSVNGLLVQPCSSLHTYTTRYPASILIESGSEAKYSDHDISVTVGVVQGSLPTGDIDSSGGFRTGPVVVVSAL